jgi:capsular polysaccharide biosynthesis protein
VKLNNKLEAQKELQNRYDKLANELESSTKTVTELTEELEISKAQKAATDDQVNTKIEKIQSTLASLQPQLQGAVEIIALQKQLDAQNKEIADLRKTLEALLALADQ